MAASCARLSFAQAIAASMTEAVIDVSLSVAKGKVAHLIASNESSSFNLPNVPPGRHEVAVEMAGFKKKVQGNISIGVDFTPSADGRLSCDNVTKTAKADFAANISQMQMESLPICSQEALKASNRGVFGLLNEGQRFTLLPQRLGILHSQSEVRI